MEIIWNKGKEIKRFSLFGRKRTCLRVEFSSFVIQEQKGLQRTGDITNSKLIKENILSLQSPLPVHGQQIPRVQWKDQLIPGSPPSPTCVKSPVGIYRPWSCKSIILQVATAGGTRCAHSMGLCPPQSHRSPSGPACLGLPSTGQTSSMSKSYFRDPLTKLQTQQIWGFFCFRSYHLLSVTQTSD